MWCRPGSAMHTFRSLLAVASAWMCSVNVYGQVTIEGVVRDHKQKPVYAVSVSLKGTYDGATTDSSGRFSFQTSEKGPQVLFATSISFLPFEQNITVQDQHITIDIVLKEEVTELRAVVLSAGSFEASDRKRATAILDPIDIVTTASANGDITGALKTLPGTQQIGESEGLFVRGGTAAETKTFIDGTLVNNFFFSSVPNIAQFSRFSLFIFKGTVFSTGGYSALYGQALSSVLILESIDLPDQTSASVNITALSAGAGFQQLAKNNKSSWGANYSYTNLGPAFSLIKQRQDYSRFPEYHNIDGNFCFKTSKTAMLKYYGYFSTNRLAFTRNSLDSAGYLDKFSLKNSNFYHNLSWRENIGNGWKVHAGVSYTDNKDDIHGSMQDMRKNDVLLTGLEFKNFDLDQKGIYFNGKLYFERRLKGLSAVRFGSEYNYSRDRLKYTTFNGQAFPGNVNEQIKAAFAEGDIYITNNIAAKLGGRLEHSSLLKATNIAPRFSVAYKFSQTTQVSLAYGVFYQNPERKYLPSAYQLGFMKATHYIAQLQKVANQQSLRLELFYKKYDDLIKTQIISTTESATSNDGFGDAKGLELFWRDKKTFSNFDYWISYSYLDTASFMNPSVFQVVSIAATFFSMALIYFSLCPQSRAMTYGTASAMALAKARQLDPDNPRVYLLEGQDKLYTPQEWGGSKEDAMKIFNEAKKKYERFKPESSIHPAWGKTQLNYFLTQG